MDVLMYSKREIEFLNELYFREFTQWTHWPWPADSITPEHDGKSKREAVSQNQASPSHHASMTFVLFGRNVCRTTYLFAHGIGIKRLSKHHDEVAVTPKHHGSSGRVSYNVSDQEHVVKFIKNVITEHAVPPPGRLPRMSDFTGMMLLNDITKCESTCPRLTMPTQNRERRDIIIILFIYTIYTLNKNCSFTLAFIVRTFSSLLVRLFRMARKIMPNCFQFIEGYIMYIPMIDI